jgi:hypothetical protein
MSAPGENEEGSERGEDDEEPKRGAIMWNNREEKLLVARARFLRFGRHRRIHFLSIRKADRHKHLSLQDRLIEEVRPTRL